MTLLYCESINNGKLVNLSVFWTGTLVGVGLDPNLGRYGIGSIGLYWAYANLHTGCW